MRAPFTSVDYILLNEGIVVSKVAFKDAIAIEFYSAKDEYNFLKT
jgi:hypothetical protein